jgi:peptide/nickel transport system permease protein
MLVYTVRRLLHIIPLLFAASIVMYTLLALQPGDPLDAIRQQHPRLTDAALKALAHAYGLDQPIYIRYVKWLGRALQGDLGQSRTYGISAAQYVFTERLPNTCVLSGLALLLALTVAIPIGVLSAVHQYSLMDYAITFCSFVGFSTPVFLLGLGLLYLFAFFGPEHLGLPALPTSGVPDVLWSDVREGAVSLVSYLRQWVAHLLLPVMALALIQIAVWSRFIRASLLEVLQHDYIRTARAKGLAERWVVYKHALRNALIPMVTLVGLALPGLCGGAVITETIFSFPGMGQAIFEALTAKDYNVAMAALALLALLTAVCNLMADLLYAVVDPRICYD